MIMQMLLSLRCFHRIRHNAKSAGRQKESVENADFYKPVFNKIMTTHE